MDKHEWQFALRKAVTWSEEEVKHGFHGESAARAEATQWLKLKAQGLFEDEGEAKDLASKALGDVLPKKGAGAGNGVEAIKDKSDDEEESSCSQKKKDEQVVEADLLSEMGKAVPKKECQVRVNRMVKLLKAVKKEVGAAKGKCLEQPLADLVKMEKQGSKLPLEDAKGKLFDAALQIKKAKKP